MTDWIIVHNIASYLEHPDHIGRTVEKKPWWLEKMKRGDRLIYYTTKEGYVVDIGVITSESQFWDHDDFWSKTWVRSFRSYFPARKGLLLTRDELKRVSKTAAANIGTHALPAAIEMKAHEFDKVAEYVREKLFP